MLAKLLKIYFCIFILCITAATVTAVPVAGTSVLVSSLGSYPGGDLSLSAPVMLTSSEHELASIAKKFLQPPCIISDAKPTSSPDNKSLPGVPSAVLLGLIGFLCVTGVKDRKEWLTALAMVLWLSMAGIIALPNLISHCQAKKQAKHSSCLEKSYACLFENSSRLRSEVEGSKYIGLLHYLSSIPDSLSRATSNLNTSQPAIVTKRDVFYVCTNCTAVQAEQFTFFSLAFIFNSLPRGPPLFA